VSLPADIGNLRQLVRRLLLAEILQPAGRPGPLEPPPSARRARSRRMRDRWVMTIRRPRSGRR
jgi:hypothetical protein